MVLQYLQHFDNYCLMPEKKYSPLPKDIKLALFSLLCKSAHLFVQLRTVKRNVKDMETSEGLFIPEQIGTGCLDPSNR